MPVPIPYADSMSPVPDFNGFEAACRDGNVVPVTLELTADGLTPVSAFNKLARRGNSFLFESITGGEQIGRFSFLGTDPRQIISAFENETLIFERDGTRKTIPTPSDPLTLVSDTLKGVRHVERPELPPFTGGAVGFLAHEYIHRIEPTVPTSTVDRVNSPLLHFAVFDTVVAFDHVRQIITLIVNVHTDQFSSVRDGWNWANGVLQETVEQLSAEVTLTLASPATTTTIPIPVGNFTRDAFEDVVRKAKCYIESGDIIQVVCSQRFELPFKEDPLDLYRALRIVNPSPYMVMFETPDFSIVGASPEVHVRNSQGRVEIRPIAGTRPRGATIQEDRSLEQDLLGDAKERAEHLMLVDLARNDIGRVCKPGTVRVEEYAAIEHYSHVMHIVSQVEGVLRDDCDAFELMRATFPAGTLSGAPKVRALQIISEFEQDKRGVYGGALGYFSYNGNLDSCIAIRTAFIRNGTIYVQSGAGLVADSDPSAEFDETVNKAKAMLKAIELSRSLASMKNADNRSHTTAAQNQNATSSQADAES